MGASCSGGSSGTTREDLERLQSRPSKRTGRRAIPRCATAARYLDTETGLDHDRARYYDPSLARFISEDPIGLAGGINPYAYAGNDPVNGTDPSGLLTQVGPGGCESWQEVVRGTCVGDIEGVVVTGRIEFGRLWEASGYVRPTGRMPVGGPTIIALTVPHGGGIGARLVSTYKRAREFASEHQCGVAIGVGAFTLATDLVGLSALRGGLKEARLMAEAGRRFAEWKAVRNSAWTSLFLPSRLVAGGSLAAQSLTAARADGKALAAGVLGMVPGIDLALAADDIAEACYGKSFIPVF